MRRRVDQITATGLTVQLLAALLALGLSVGEARAQADYTFVQITGLSPYTSNTQPGGRQFTAHGVVQVPGASSVTLKFWIALYPATGCGGGAIPTPEVTVAPGTFGVPLMVPTGALNAGGAVTRLSISAELVGVTPPPGSPSPCFSWPVSYYLAWISHSQITAISPATSVSSPSRVDTVQLSGTDLPNISVSAYVNSNCSQSPPYLPPTAPAATTRASATGAFTLAVPVTGTSDGPVRLMVGCSPPRTHYRDRTPPAVTLTTTSPASSRSSPATSLSVTVNGQTDANATVQLFTTSDCSDAIAKTAAGASGAFSIPVTLTKLSATPFHARATDAAGNVSPCSSPALFYHAAEEVKAVR